MSDALLDALDEEQRQVATSLGGPVCVLAGAGTGKTRALTHRIAYGVATGDYSPQHVMALTFTTRAAGELRGRLAQLDAGGVQARTFHSAALAQLNHFWPQLTGGAAPSVIDSKARTIADAASRQRITLDVATARDAAALIEWRKVRQLGIDALETELTLGRRQPPGRLSIEQTVDLLRGYETLKDERKQIDFEDVLLLTAGMLADEPLIAAQVREQYRHFLVDEFQDVSPIQHELLQLWLGERRDVCVVGDASQTIYSFAGASPNYLLQFEQHHDGAEVIRLERNYRSTPQIVSAANTLMRGRPGALTLHAQRPDGVAIAEQAAESDHAEAQWVAEQIAAAIAAGTSPDEIAVLYRMNAQSEPIERALSALDIPYQVRGGVPFFERSEIRQALMQLRAEALSNTGSRPLFQVVSDVLWSLGWSNQAPESAGAVRERWESLNVLATLADAAAGSSIAEFVEQLQLRAKLGHQPALGQVTLASIHSAKGLEWSRVFVIGLSEGLLPVSYASSLEAIDEERRLMYVALTRARDALSLSWARQGVRGERAPSRFLAELRPPSSNRSAHAPATPPADADRQR